SPATPAWSPRGSCSPGPWPAPPRRPGPWPTPLSPDCHRFVILSPAGRHSGRPRSCTCRPTEGSIGMRGQLRVAAIVPAYNEGATLHEVLSVLQATPAVGEVLVVSDGSTDDTVEIARSLGLRTIHLRQNQGKGRAMEIGVAHTDAEVLLFVDADILN